MDKYIIPMICMAAYIVLAPFIGGILDGFDRKISARMQGRKGPSVLQPFYDVAKLFHKQLLVMNKFQTLMVMSYLFFVLLSLKTASFLYFCHLNECPEHKLKRVTIDQFKHFFFL